ncbi:MAG: DUF1580 domain-containing protein [Planctomycetaceae bacterium]|nr:DUF1580 domain-containing protein [Planctomycetaceae bacterium]
MTVALLANGGKLHRLSEAAKFLPTRPNASTIWRWATKGVRGVRLETVRVGGFHYVSEEALEAFLEATNEPTQPVAPVKQPRTAKQRRESARRAQAILARAGI